MDICPKLKVQEPIPLYGFQPITATSTDLDLIKQARDGLKTAALWKFLKLINCSKMEFEEYLPLSLKTLGRKETLNEAEGERILNIMRVFAKGKELFDDVEVFKRWLKEDNPFLGDAPITFLKTSTGCQVILDEIGRAQHGIMA